MAQQGNESNWVWVFIQQYLEGDKLVGRVDEQNGEQFIPFFEVKEAGLACKHAFKKEMGPDYVLQAMLFEELTDYAKENGFSLYKLDGEGHIVEKLRLEH